MSTFDLPATSHDSVHHAAAEGRPRTHRAAELELEREPAADATGGQRGYDERTLASHRDLQWETVTQ